MGAMSEALIDRSTPYQAFARAGKNLFLDDLDGHLAGRGQKAVRDCADLLAPCRDPQAAEDAVEIGDALLGEPDLDLRRCLELKALSAPKADPLDRS